MTSQESAPSAGASGLGKMPSMDPKCTPLKHSYDKCFNLWFEEYLGIDPSAAGAKGTTPQPAGETRDPSSASTEGKRSWLKPWSRSSEENAPPAPRAAPTEGQRQRQTSYAHLPLDALAAQAKRAELRAKFDDCSQLFASYQACVRAAVHERGLEPLIEEARVYNPFPFPKQ